MTATSVGAVKAKISAGAIAALLLAGAPVGTLTILHASTAYATGSTDDPTDQIPPPRDGEKDDGGVTTPELPSGLLVAFGLMPLGLAAWTIRRRRIANR